MNFNLTYFGPESTFGLRRDYFLSLKYSLEDLGHRVDISHLFLDPRSFNLIVGAYFLGRDEIARIAQSGVAFANINTEIVKNDCLNLNPGKTDFLGAYLPCLRAGKFVWEVVIDNMAEHARYGLNAHFQRWGWHPKLEDIEHRAEKDLDFYFFGMLTDRRKAVISDLARRGLNGLADHACPYFMRNDRIARAKVSLNIIQHDAYIHTNSFRVCYLANNRAAIVSEAENDPAGYLEVCRIAPKDAFGDTVEEAVRSGAWQALARTSYETFRQRPMRDMMAALLDASFA
jgi:hypothetical protein